MKAKLPLKKKEVEYDESEEIQEDDNSSHQDDETGATDVSEVNLDDVEEESANSSLVHKLKSKLQNLQKKSPAGKNGGDDKRKKIVYGLIGVGLLVILFSDEIFPPEPEQPATPSFVRPVRKKPVQKTETETPSETPQVDSGAVATDTSAVPETTTAPTDSATTTETPTDSAVDVTSTDSTVPAETLPETPVETMPETTPETVTTTPETPTETPTETTMEPTDPMVGAETPSSDFSPSVDSIDGETPTSDDNLTDQILQDLEKQAKSSEITETKKEYVSPPDYEYRGRGLVYNCTGKHWACVDAPSYKTCEENASSTKFLNKPSECYPFNVYESPKGCELMQNRMVSSSAKTEFCND